MGKVKWGVLSTAKIGRKKVIPAIQQASNCTVQAIASRSEKKARKTANALNISDFYSFYNSLLEQPDLDAIYIPLPNHLHVHWAIKAMQAGKHVLCEKPVGMNVDEAIKLYNTSKKHPDLKIMEGFMYRHHPQWEYVKKQVDDHSIGTLRTINTMFTYYKDDPQNIRNRPETGGGGLMDIGCYALSVARFLFGEEPRQVVSHVDFDSTFDIDYLASGILQFSSGTSTFTCSTQASSQQSVEIYGTDALLEVEIPFNPPWTDRTYVYKHTNEGTKQVEFEPVNQFTIQAERFADSIINDTPPPVPLSDAVYNMNLIDFIYKSSEKGQWQPIKKPDV